MNKPLKYVFAIAAALCMVVTAAAQQLAVEHFTIDEKDQTARITNPRKDQNDKMCAIVKLETSLLLPDFDFDAGSVGITHTEQKTGEIWVYLSSGTLRITINHKYLGTIRNYEFGEALKEATVYIMKLSSGNVKTVVEDNVTRQYMEVVCEADGATISIDDAAPEPFTKDRKFSKLLSYGKHKYTIEAPLYHPLNGITEVTAKKQPPIQAELQPAFGKLTVNTQPEQGADVFVDGEKRGQSPLTINRLGSGTHKIHVIKELFLSVTQEKTITDGAMETLTLSMQPNFAVITLTTPDGGDIYLNDEKKGNTTWSGRLTPGQYKAEVRKPSHRSSVTTIDSEAGKDKTIPLKAPAPIYGSLDVKSGNATAAIFIDGKKYETTPAIIKNILAGSHSIELRADGYKPHRQTIEVREGKILPVSAMLQEENKTGAMTPAAHKNNKLKAPIQPAWFISYRMSPPTSYLGLSAGYCKRFGGYLQYRTDIVTGQEKNLADVDRYFNGSEREYFRSSMTAGGMFCLFNFMYVYGGLGYGKYGAVYKAGATYSSGETYHTAGLIKGLELEGGLTFKIGKSLSLTAGYSTISESDFGELHFGVGVVF